MGQRTIDTILRLQNESEYRTALKNCTTDLKTLKSELALVTSEYRNNANSMEALTAKGDVLSRMYDAQEEKVSLLRGALEKAQQTQSEEQEQVARLRDQYEQAKKTLADFGDEVDKSSEEYQKAKAETDKLRDAVIKHEAKLTAATTSVGKYSTQLNRAQIELNQMKDQQNQNNRLLEEAKASADGCAASIDKYGDAVKAAADGTGQTVSAVDTLSTALVAGGIQQKVEDIAAAMMEASEAAQTFEKSVAQVSTISDKSVLSTDDMRKGILDLSADLRKSADEVAGAVYDALSSGIDTADALNFTAQAAQLAEAGFTDVGTSVDVLTSILNAYKLEAGQTEAVASKLVKTQDLGKITVDDLGKVIGRVIPSAAAYSVNLDNIATAYANMTASGINAENTTTYLSTLLDELADSGSDVAIVLQEQTGKSFKELMDQGSSLGDVLAIIGESVENDTVKFSNLWSSASAGKAALSLFNGSADEFNATLQQMADATGTVAKNYEEMTSISEYAGRRLDVACENLSIAVGQQLNPVLDNLREAGAGLIEEATKVVEENPALVAAVSGLGTALGLLATGVSALMIAKSAAKAMEALNISLAANPAGLVAVAVSGLVAGLLTFVAQAKESSTEVDKLTESAQRLNDAVANNGTAYEDSIISTEAAVSAAGEYIDRLEELEMQGIETEEQQLEYSILLEKINSILPGINAELDAQTGLVKGGTVALRDQVVAWQNAALAEAAYTRYKDDISALADAEYELAKNKALLKIAMEDEKKLRSQTEPLLERQKDLTEQLNNLNADGTMDIKEYQQEYERLFNELADVNAEYSKMTSALDENSTQQDDLREAIVTGSRAVDDAQEEVQACTDAYQQYSDQLGVAADDTESATSQMSDATAEAMQAMVDAYNEAYISARKSIDGQIGLFDDLSGKCDMSTEDMIKNLLKQREAFDNYAENIVKAVEMGIDTGLIQKLSDGSAESMLILQELVNGTGDKVDDLNDAFQGVNESKNTLADLIAAMSATAEESWPDLIATWEENAGNLGETFASAANESMEDGLEDGESALVDSGEKMVENLDAELPQIKVDIRAQGKSMGQAMVDGAIAGIESKKNLYNLATKGLADGGAESYKRANDQHSPSRRYRRLAAHDVEGLVVQYQADTPKLQKASTDMADAGYVSAIKARRAALPSIAATAAAPASRTSADSQLLQQILEAIRVGQTLLLDGSLVVGGTANRYNATLGEAIMLTERGAT